MVESKEKGDAESTPKGAEMEVPFWREKIIILVCFAIFAFDQVTKSVVVSQFPPNPGMMESPHYEKYKKYELLKQQLRRVKDPEERREIQKEIKPILGKYEKIVVGGFLSIIHRTNDGAAFSILQGKNNILAVISFIAMGGLIGFRHHFDNGTRVSKLALGLLMGGILGNLADRVFRESVVDFVRVYIERGGGKVSEWPAFNVADAAICAGVGFLFYIAWTEGTEKEEATT